MCIMNIFVIFSYGGNSPTVKLKLRDNKLFVLFITRNWDSSVLGGVANFQATMVTPTFLERWRQCRTSSKFVPYQVLFSAVHKAIDILFARSITRKVLQPFVKHASLVLLRPIIADCGAEL